MSFNYFVYEMGIVDEFTFMTPLIDYINSSIGVKDDDNFGGVYLSHRELKGFLIKCFMEVMTSTKSWNGDIRGFDQIYIGSIPFPDKCPKKFICFKQDDNGSTFLVSEIKIDIYHQNKEIKWVAIVDKNMDSRDVLNRFYYCFDLVEELFKKAFGTQRIVEKGGELRPGFNIISLEDKQVPVYAMNPENMKNPPKPTSANDPLKCEKFNMDNYLKV